MGYPGDEDELGGNGQPNGEGTFEAEEQLSLTDDDADLPWLDSDDEEEEEGTDYRILGFAVAAVLLLVALLWGASHLFGGSGEDATVEPDGSTIEAPEEAYKSAPTNPGGSEVAGTGDLSYEVGEGQGREGRIADDVPAPSIDTEQAAASGSAAPAASSGVGVQVGAYQSRASAETGWQQLSGRFEALQGVSHRIIEGQADSGTIFRLQAVAGDVAAAEALCRSIKAAGGDCQVKR